MAHMWLLMIYKVPPEPTAGRVYVWRKLKRLGAILLHDAVWILPPTTYTREQLQWLSGEITELGGEVLLWEAQLTLPNQNQALVEQFVAQADHAYQELLTELDGPEPDLAAISRRYQQTKTSDYFESAFGQQVRVKLLLAKGRDDS